MIVTAQHPAERVADIKTYANVKSNPHPSPLPGGEGADRSVWRYLSTCYIKLIMDSVNFFHVGVVLKYPAFSPLSLWERVRVRAF